MGQYEDFAFIYDELMDNVDYENWVSYIEEIIKREDVQVKNILELACGTGNITIPLAKKDYDIVGIDISQEMLNVARDKCYDDEIEVIFLNQDIKELDFEVYNLDCVLCCCDGFNYILKNEELEFIFKKIHTILKEGGIFIFDISSYYKLSEILSNNVFGENREELAYIWENEFNSENNTITMNVAFFVQEKKLFKRHEETHYQRAYTEEEIFDILNKAGFLDIKMYTDFTFTQKNQGERQFFVCKKACTL